MVVEGIRSLLSLQKIVERIHGGKQMNFAFFFFFVKVDNHSLGNISLTRCGLSNHQPKES